MPHRIDTSDETQRWEYACPTPQRHRHWRVVNGSIQCRPCDETYDELVHLPTGEHVAREDIEIVGSHADHQARFDPRV